MGRAGEILYSHAEEEKKKAKRLKRTEGVIHMQQDHNYAHQLDFAH